jgi:hypothetical protein
LWQGSQERAEKLPYRVPERKIMVDRLPVIIPGLFFIVASCDPDLGLG